MNNLTSVVLSNVSRDLSILEMTTVYMESIEKNNLYTHISINKSSLLMLIYDEVRFSFNELVSPDKKEKAVGEIQLIVYNIWREHSLHKDYVDYILFKRRLIDEVDLLIEELISLFTTLSVLKVYICYKADFIRGFPVLQLVNEHNIDDLNTDEIYAYLLTSGGVI